MPRPKVRPESRLRSTKACDLCRASKIRCDAQVPCATCKKRDRPGDCVYSVPGAPSSRRGRLIETTTATARLAVSGSPSCVVDEYSESATTSHFEQMPSPASSANVAPDIAIAEQDSPRESYLKGSNGDEVYIGDTASLSFLDFLRRNLRVFVGSTSFTDGARQSLILDEDASVVTPEELILDAEDRSDLFESYSEASSALLHLFSEAEISEHLTQPPQVVNVVPKHVDEAAMNMALAIGAQARASGPQDAQCATVFFAQAQSVAFQDALTRPSLGMVRLFLLLAFFSLGACRQNAAFIYLGVASKAAIALGLHQPMSYKDRHQSSGPELRLRIWHSLCILDVLTSSILGRPVTVPRATRHDLHSLPLDPGQPAFNSVLKGCALMDDICRVLSKGTVIDVPTAQELLRSLRQWSQSLPQCLRHFSLDEPSPLSMDCRTFIGRVHVSSVYYFSVMLVTRPFLIRHAMAKLRQRAGSQAQVITGHRELGLAHVCMSAATYMGNLCQKMFTVVTMSNLPFGNLCLFKTWAFSAGLILGFSLFAGESTCDFQSALDGVRDILAKMGEVSPQSRLYGETLGAFMDTIKTYRRQTSRTARQMVDEYLDQILAVDVPTNLPSHDAPKAGESEMSLGTWGGGSLDSNLIAAEGTFLTGLETMDVSWLTDETWGAAALQFSDNFSVDYSGI